MTVTGCLAHLIRNAKENADRIELMPENKQDSNALGFCKSVKKFFALCCRIDQRRKSGGARYLRGPRQTVMGTGFPGSLHAAHQLHRRGPRQALALAYTPDAVEDAFGVSKSDLGLRPVYQQKHDRVQAHIMVCFLALAMWRVLEAWLCSKHLGDCARQIIKQMETIHSMDVLLPVKDKANLRLRLVAKPDKLTADLLDNMGLKIPSRPKIVENVVEKNG